jgi:hypothetical protein
MGKKKYRISWIALVGDTMADHEHKTISYVDEFANVEKALDWAKTRLTIEVQECSNKGEVIPLTMNNLNRKVEWGFWYPESDESP